LLVQCENALYGTMDASLSYYRKFVKSLTDIEFVINPYDPCVANKTIEGEKMTICFYFDDWKLNHRNRKVMDRMIGCFRQEYERIFEDGSGSMTVSRCKVHKYLGMTLDYTVRSQVRISMLTTSTRS
jgi:protease II